MQENNIIEFEGRYINMKKFAIAICLLLILCACTNKKEEDVSVGNEPASLDKTPLTDEYMAKMDDYEFMEIALLGCISEERSLEDILERAVNDWGFEFISEIKNDHIIKGEQGKWGNYVYLLIPARVNELAISSFNSEDRLYFRQEDPTPVIYIETDAGMTPRGMIEYVLQNGETGHIYTGVCYKGSELRTAYHMGLVDVSHYEDMTSAEIGFYEQPIFDTMYYTAPELSEFLQKGYEASYMDEMLYEGKMYLIYHVFEKNDSSNDFLYGISYDTETGTFSFIKSFDGEGWYEPSQAKG